MATNPAARAVSGQHLPLLLPVQFDFTDRQGETVLRIKRQRRQPHQYDITVADDHLDWRLAAACAVAADALTTFWMAGPANTAR